MTIKTVRYRAAYNTPYVEEPAPGPLPQAHTKKYPTSTTVCTCGHIGPLHRQQTLTTPPWAQGNALRFRGRCTGFDIDTRYTRPEKPCPCSWFTEDLDDYETRIMRTVETT